MTIEIIISRAVRKHFSSLLEMAYRQSLDLKLPTTKGSSPVPSTGHSGGGSAPEADQGFAHLFCFSQKDWISSPLASSCDSMSFLKCHVLPLNETVHPTVRNPERDSLCTAVRIVRGLSVKVETSQRSLGACLESSLFSD